MLAFQQQAGGGRWREAPQATRASLTGQVGGLPGGCPINTDTATHTSHAGLLSESGGCHCQAEALRAGGSCSAHHICDGDIGWVVPPSDDRDARHGHMVPLRHRHGQRPGLDWRGGLRHGQGGGSHRSGMLLPPLLLLLLLRTERT